MQDAKEEVRSRLNIEDVIGEYVQLRRAGRNFKGLSPFGAEKTPSFFVNPEKHIWHDFSSNQGGDVFSFIMRVEGLDFRAALELLARKAGVDLSQFSNSGNGDLAKKKQRLLSLLDLASQYYQQSLVSNKHALSYAVGARKLNKQTITDFRIGYSPDTGSALTQFLKKKGYSEAELRDAGLLNRFGGDFFRGRLQVTLMDGQGQVIGFTARLITDKPDAPKYINTPQTILYDKGRHVFGLHLAKESIRQKDYAVIVEGNMDVVASHQAGVANVVATAGTALTESHLRALVRLSGNVRLAFDADRAGLAATERAIPIAQAVGVNLQIVSVGDGVKDPDELIQKDPALWQAAIERAQPAIDWVLGQYASRFDLETGAGKRDFTTDALRLVSPLVDAVEKEHYIGVIATKIGSSREALLQKMALPKEEKQLKRVAPQANERDEDSGLVMEDNLLGLMAINPDARMSVNKPLLLTLLTGKQLRLATRIAELPSERLDEAAIDLPDIEVYVKIVVATAEERYGDWSGDQLQREAVELERQIKTKNIRHRKDRLAHELRMAEDGDDDALVQKLRGEMNLLIKELGNATR